jgi:hypothetical protein
LEIRDKRYAFEEYFLELLRSLKNPHKAEMSFRNFLEKVRPLENEAFEKVAFEYFDFVAWAESKLLPETLAERVKARISLRDVL